MKSSCLSVRTIWFVITLFVLSLSMPAAAGPAKSAAPAPEKTVISLTTSPDKLGPNEYVSAAEAETLALQLANLIQGTQGRAALFLSLDGVYLVDLDVLADLAAMGNTEIYNFDYPDNSDQPGLLQAFLEAGGRVVVCPACAGRRGVTQETSVKGVEWGNAESLSELFNKMGKALSY